MMRALAGLVLALTVVVAPPASADGEYDPPIAPPLTNADFGLPSVITTHGPLTLDVAAATWQPGIQVGIDHRGYPDDAHATAEAGLVTVRIPRKVPTGIVTIHYAPCRIWASDAVPGSAMMCGYSGVMALVVAPPTAHTGHHPVMKVRMRAGHQRLARLELRWPRGGSVLYTPPGIRVRTHERGRHWGMDAPTAIRVASWLRPGRYRVPVHVRGEGRGRLVVIVKRVSHSHGHADACRIEARR